MTFAKVSGPAWLSVAGNGALSGTPAAGDIGLNTLTISVSDGILAPVAETLEISVVDPSVNNAPIFTMDPFSVSDTIVDVTYSDTIMDDEFVRKGVASIFIEVEPFGESVR